MLKMIIGVVVVVACLAIGFAWSDLPRWIGPLLGGGLITWGFWEFKTQ
jgi:hypothetical protein